MVKIGGMNPRFSIMLCEIVLISVFFHLALSFESYEDDSHQSFLPLAHSDKQGYWTYVEEKSPRVVLPSPRLGHRVLKLPQTFIPFSRTGRMQIDPEVYDYDLSLIPDHTWNNFDDPITDNYLEGKSNPKKRGNIGMPPRFGRKKRSISDDDDDTENTNSKKLQGTLNRMVNSDWSFLADLEPDFYMRPERRGGSSKSRMTFVPRVGKKRSYEDLEDITEKRAMSLTPRIGRASLIPRIGRNDPRFEVKSRGAFIPRIGKRASLTPRIGRSGIHHSNNDESE